MDESLAYRSLTDLRTLLDAGDITSLDLVRTSLARIAALDRQGPTLRAVIETNPDAEEIAAALDQEERRRGPLHGIPILLKDNIDTLDRMATTAGSLALVGARVGEDAGVAARLRAAGAVLIGKANLSEWANFRGAHSSSGWSARGGQARNPYVLDRSPCGSSSGSASAVAAGYVAGALGTETSGSILCPAAGCGIVGIKATVGLTSRAGVIPIAHSQDVVGPMTRTVADAALLLSAIAGPDPRDPVTMDAPPLGSLVAGGEHDLHGFRLGVPRTVYWGYSPKADAVAETALDALRDLGAEIVDPADIPTAEEMRGSTSMLDVLLYEFKADLDAYLAALPVSPVRFLADVIRFNREHAAEELAYFGQERMEEAEECGPLTDQAYLDARAECLRLARDEGIDAVMKEHRLDALVMPTTGPMWPIDLVNGDAHGGGGSAGPGAMAGYPSITIPIGLVQELPIGLTFTGRAWSESTLIRLAAALESALPPLPPPRFLPTTLV